MLERYTRLTLRQTRQKKTNRPALIRTWRLVATVTLIAFASAYVAFAAISLSTSVPSTQDFASMGIPLSNPASSSLPVEFRQDTRGIARTVGDYSSASLQTDLVGGANLSSTATNGSYNFGAGTSTLGDSDRAVGFLSSGGGSISGNLYARFQNNTGLPLTGLVISYDVEKYRNGSNALGFRYQLFYSHDGAAWNNAGPDFLTAFTPDANNNGFATAPGATQSVINKSLTVSVANGASIYLAWNYSVASGNTPTNAQALAIDNISVLGVGSATNPNGAGTANPNSVLPGAASTLTVSVTPGTNPTSTGLTVTGDLSGIGGSATQQFFDDGTNGGDVAAGDNVFTHVATVAPGTTAGPKSLPFSVTDAQSRSGNGSISLIVQQPAPPVDHLVISQLYGGGGNTGATLTHDYIEIYNPTGISFNLAGWSLQYASATGTSWTNKQPLGGTVAPGEYFLVQLASGGANGSALPVTANISGDINLSATTGKVALVSNSVSLTGSCPNGTDSDIVDFVGYGTSASCFEGGAPAPAPSNTNALFRKLNGGQDTNQNGDDFETGAPTPRRTAPIVELGPWVAGNEPIADGFNAPYDATVTVDFSEPVDVVGNWFDISCASSGQHNSATVASYNSSKGFHITPNTGFQFGEQCTVTIFHGNVHDQDLDDSSPNTDTLFADHSWSFTVVAAGAPAPHPASVHLAMGNPSNAVADLQQFNNYLMEKPSFALSYNRDKGTPNWVSWHLENDWTGSLPRMDTFRSDPAVSPDWYRVQSTDYFASGFDRGHMTPNADRDNPASIPLNQETFLMSNTVPQAPDINQGPWADFENFLRTLLPANEVYIVAGPEGTGGLGDNGPATTIANGRVTVPAHTWKVVLVLPLGENDISRVNAATRTIAVIMPNLNGTEPDWQSYITTVDHVEALTGYDFFANLPDAIENAVEAGIDGTNPPGTENQAVTTEEDVPAEIVLNAVSPLATPTFTFTIMSQPSHGVLSGDGPNFTYTPAPNFHGSDSFTFRVHDTGDLGSNTSTVNITVTEVNDAPTANSQSVTTNANTAVGVTLTGNDLETAAENLLFEVTVNPAHGSLSGTGANLTYIPNTNYSGPDSFEFTVRDTGDGASAALTSSSATVSITVNDTIAPTIVPPAPTSVNANGNGKATIPDVVAAATATDNSGAVTVAQSPLAGTLVGPGTHTITITATDAAGNTTTATTTFTVIDHGLRFSLTVSPTTVQPGKLAKLDIAYANVSTERLSVSFTVRSTGPCDSSIIGTVGPAPINAGASKNANVQYHVPRTACTGSYTLTAETFVNGVFVGTATAELIVTADPTMAKRNRAH